MNNVLKMKISGLSLGLICSLIILALSMAAPAIAPTNRVVTTALYIAVGVLFPIVLCGLFFHRARTGG